MTDELLDLNKAKELCAAADNARDEDGYECFFNVAEIELLGYARVNLPRYVEEIERTGKLLDHAIYLLQMADDPALREHGDRLETEWLEPLEHAIAPTFDAERAMMRKECEGRLPTTEGRLSEFCGRLLNEIEKQKKAEADYLALHERDCRDLAKAEAEIASLQGETDALAKLCAEEEKSKEYNAELVRERDKEIERLRAVLPAPNSTCGKAG